MQNQATISISFPIRSSSFQNSDDVISCDLWFGPAPIKNLGYAYAKVQSHSLQYVLANALNFSESSSRNLKVMNDYVLGIFLVEYQTSRCLFCNILLISHNFCRISKAKFDCRTSLSVFWKIFCLVNTFLMSRKFKTRGS